MMRTQETPERRAKRQQARELFSKGHTQAEIVAAVNVPQPTVAYWQKVDGWVKLEELPKEADGTAIKAYLRSNLGQHLRTLSAIIEGTGQDRVRVVAIREYAIICKLVGALDLSDSSASDSKVVSLPEFSDELDKGE